MCPLSLVIGVKDLVVVEAAEDRNGDLSSRAFVLYAATLEVRRREHSGQSHDSHLAVYHDRH
jgi:hypothetical protein